MGDEAVREEGLGCFFDLTGEMENPADVAFGLGGRMQVEGVGYIWKMKTFWALPAAGLYTTSPHFVPGFSFLSLTHYKTGICAFFKNGIRYFVFPFWYKIFL